MCSAIRVLVKKLLSEYLTVENYKFHACSRLSKEHFYIHMCIFILSHFYYYYLFLCSVLCILDISHKNMAKQHKAYFRFILHTLFILLRVREHYLFICMYIRTYAIYLVKKIRNKNTHIFVFVAMRTKQVILNAYLSNV